MRRRKFLTRVGGAAATWPLMARGQGTHRVGVFLYLKEQDSEGIAYVAAFEKQLRALGWVPGQNLQVDYRWTGCCGWLTRWSIAANHLDHSYRLCSSYRSCRRRIRQQSVEAWAKCDGIYRVRLRHRWQVAGVAKTSCAFSDPGCCSPRSGESFGRRFVRRYPSPSTISTSRGCADKFAGC